VVCGGTHARLCVVNRLHSQVKKDLATKSEFVM
jgi:hypothetical protein